MADLTDIALRILTAFNSHDPETLAALYSENQVTIVPGEPDPLRGRPAKAEMLARLFRGFPDLTLTLSLILPSGDHVVCEGTMRGTHTGPLVSRDDEVPPTGRAITLPIVYILKVDSDGLVSEDRTYLDNAALLAQMGLL